MCVRITLLLLFIVGALRAMPTDSIRMEKRSGQWFVVHVIEATETLYGLAKRYGCKIKDIRAHNIGTHILSVGQQLYIPHKGPLVAEKPIQNHLPAAREVRKGAELGFWASDSLFRRPFQFRFVEEEGTAAVAVATAAGRYALHRHAPLGTFIRLQNQINGQQLLVRVIGRIPEIDANKKTLVQLSATAYAELRSPDTRTRVKIRYLQ